MPPKQVDGSSQKNNDALYVFDSLFHVATPIVINVNEIASQTGAKPNTIIKRFSIFRQRYPGLNIQTTAAPSNAVASASGAVPAIPGPRRPPKSTASTGPTQKAKPKLAIRKGQKPNKAGHQADTDDETATLVNRNNRNDTVDNAIAEAADDETTPVKQPPKRKRITSTVKTSSKTGPITKKHKKEVDPDETVSEDDLSIHKVTQKSSNATKPYSAKSTSTSKAKSRIKKKKQEVLSDQDSETETEDEERDEDVTVTATEVDDEAEAGDEDKGGNEGESEDEDEDESEGMSITRPLPAVVPQKQSATPNHTSLPKIVTPAQHPSSDSKTDHTNSQLQANPATTSDPAQVLERPDLLVYGNTLLRKISGAKVQSGNRIVGIDISLDAAVDELSNRNEDGNGNTDDDTAEQGQSIGRDKNDLDSLNDVAGASAGDGGGGEVSAFNGTRDESGHRKYEWMDLAVRDTQSA